MAYVLLFHTVVSKERNADPYDWKMNPRNGLWSLIVFCIWTVEHVFIYKATGFHKIIVVFFPNQEFTIFIDFARQPLFFICGNQVELEDDINAISAFSRYFAILQYIGVFFLRDSTPPPTTLNVVIFFEAFGIDPSFFCPWLLFYLLFVTLDYSNLCMKETFHFFSFYIFKTTKNYHLWIRNDDIHLKV